MKILFDDDRGNRIAVDCSSVAAIPDPDSDGWVVVASEICGRDMIIRAGIDEAEAKRIVRRLFDMGVYVPGVHDV